MMSDSVPLVSPVPWASKKEFLRVANWIKGKRKREWNKARERMEMWKSRAEGNGGRMSAGEDKEVKQIPKGTFYPLCLHRL